MRKTMGIAMMAFLLSGPGAWAHEGHDAAKYAKPKKGGVIKSVEDTSIEVVARGKDLKIYLYDKDMNPQAVDAVKMTAQAEIPRSKKVEPVALQAKNDHYEAIYDSKEAHRYNLLLSWKGNDGHDEKVSFTIEPKK